MKIEKTDEGTEHQVTRVRNIQGDMGEGTMLHFHQQPDGDVIVILTNREENTMNSIEFCTSSGGGHYPWLTRMLREIITECEKQIGG
ncbi:hypothetical protein LCGC14_3082010 [marine sediment metagenome]|uniref:Uncharacterized protein n=1 Tax=marine sediment metagenome TaxID=412755 RepID=A0A0F8Z3P3_9ZZZZ